MNKEKVISREYKIMLKAEKFKGDEKELIKNAAKFWSAVKEEIDSPDKSLALDTDGKLNKIKERRTISFYDTNTCRLRRNNYVFRKRKDIETGKREVTLKFRHPDRYIAQDRNMDAKDTRKGKTKFEEDIKPEFLKLYSFSTKLEISDSKHLNKMNDPADLFQDLKENIDDYNKNEEIKKVGNFTALELVIEGADFQISKSPKLEADCALVVWYDKKGDHKDPLLVEFSFKYGDNEENYDKKMAQRAFNIFKRLQKLEEWINPNPMTKMLMCIVCKNVKHI